MNTADWIGICIAVSTIVGIVVWGITYCCCGYSRKLNCYHDFEKVYEIDKPGVHKVAYLCKKCGLVKKVNL